MDTSSSSIILEGFEGSKESISDSAREVIIESSLEGSLTIVVISSLLGDPTGIRKWSK